MTALNILALDFKALKDYGSIIIKIIDGSITKEVITSFSEDLNSYKLSSKNNIHLAIMIGDDVSEDSYVLAMKLERKGFGYFVLVEKPSPLST